MNWGFCVDISAVRTGGGTKIFEFHMILSGIAESCADIHKGDVIQDVTIDGLNLDNFISAASVGAILEPSDQRTEMNIGASVIYQTFDPSGKPIISNDPKFCRGCIIDRPGSTVLLVADARKGIEFQEGLTITELRTMIRALYPDYLRLSNVDGGHAAKLAVRHEETRDVFGNLHYKIWPTMSGGDFV